MKILLISYSFHDTNFIKNNYVLSILKRLSQIPDFKPLLIVNKDSQLSSFQYINNFSHLNLITGSNPLDYINIYNKWFKDQKLFIICFGIEELKTALFIKKTRLKKATYITYFLLNNTIFHIASLQKYISKIQYFFCDYGQSTLIMRKLLNEEYNLKHNYSPYVCFIRPAIDINQFIPKTSQWNKDKHFIFGLGNSIKSNSSAINVIRAMSALWQKSDLPKWELRIYGNGDNFENLYQEAQNLGVLPKLCILGEKNLAEGMQECNVWIVPGYSNEENPNLLLGGFATGLPIICSLSQFHLQILNNLDSHEALCINCENPQELAKYMIMLMQDCSLRNKLSQNSLSVRNKISLETMANYVCSILETKRNF